jgi:hypothetical protein
METAMFQVKERQKANANSPVGMAKVDVVCKIQGWLLQLEGESESERPRILTRRLQTADCKTIQLCTSATPFGLRSPSRRVEPQRAPRHPSSTPLLHLNRRG